MYVHSFVESSTDIGYFYTVCENSLSEVAAVVVGGGWWVVGGGGCECVSVCGIILT